jgi:hypothetical protein
LYGEAADTTCRPVDEHPLARDHAALFWMEETLKAVSDAMGTAAAWAKFRLFGIGDWYKSQELNPAARERLGVAWKSCCEHGDVVRTQFRVEQNGSAYGNDIWFYLKDGKWKRVPDDIIHWGEHAPDKQATPFIYQSTVQELRFYSPEEGI